MLALYGLANTGVHVYALLYIGSESVRSYYNVHVFSSFDQPEKRCRRDTTQT